MNFVEAIRKTRYVVLIPVIGLAIAASVMFLAGGIGLLMFLVQNIHTWFSGRTVEMLPVLGLVEHVDQFLIGTVLYLIALGLYQLFIEELPMRPWLKVDSGADLETNVVGVIVVVLAIEFLGAVFSGRQSDPNADGTGIALTIVALALFLGVRHWAEDKPSKPPHRPPKVVLCAPEGYSSERLGSVAVVCGGRPSNIRSRKVS